MGFIQDIANGKTVKTKKKKGFIATLAEQYGKGKKMVEDYQKSSNEREAKAAENFKKKTNLLKAKTEHAKAKAAYQKAKGGQSMFGASLGGFGEQRSSFQGTIGSGGNGYGASAWSVGGQKKAPMKRNKRKMKPKYKKVVYYR